LFFVATSAIPWFALQPGELIMQSKAAGFNVDVGLLYAACLFTPAL